MNYFIIILIIIIWIYFMQFHHGNYPKILCDDVLKKMKSGDIILFKAYDNFNSVIHGGYFGHMALVYVYKGCPMLLEANGIDHMNLMPHHNQNGVFFSPAEERIKKYKGRCFLKALNKPLCDDILCDFEPFIQYCLKNMYYDDKIFRNAISKFIGMQQLSLNTTCAEIIYLSLIKLELLPQEAFDYHILHHLNHVAYLTDLQNGYKYEPILEIIDHPFAN